MSTMNPSRWPPMPGMVYTSRAGRNTRRVSQVVPATPGRHTLWISWYNAVGQLGCSSLSEFREWVIRAEGRT